MLIILAIVGVLYTRMLSSYAIPQVKLSPRDVAYFSNEGSLTLTCTVDQDVRIASVTFRRDGINYVVIFNPTIPQCTATKYMGDDTSVYSMACDQERNFTLTKHRTSADNHRKKWTCVLNSLSGGPCVGGSNPCFSQNITSTIQVPVTTVQLMTGSGQVLSSSVNIVRGQSTGFRCSTVPNGSRPRATFQWYIRQGNQSPVLIVDQSISLTPDPITLPGQPEADLLISYSTWTLTGNTSYQDMYIYCEARDETNTGNYMKSTEVQINIVYPPVVKLFPDQSAYNVTEGMQNFIFTCNVVEAKPQPQANGYSWFHKASIIPGQTASSFTLSIVQRADAGEYRCTARNDYGNGTSDPLDLIVQYAPDVRVNISRYTVFGSTAVLMCVPQGNPPQYTFHPWIHRVGQTEIRRLDGVNTVSLSTLSLSNISIQDMGTYICTVDNSITGLDGQVNQMGESHVEVQGLPVIDKTQTTFAGEPFKSARIQIPFYSDTSIMAPIFIKQSVVSNTSDIYSFNQPSNITMMFYMKKVTISGYMAVLYFRNVTETNFGNYTLQLSNNKGTESVQVHFIASVHPSKPKKFFLIHIEDGRLVFGIEKGFNGGHDQTFIVEYQPFGMPDATWSTIFKIKETDLDNPFSNGTYFIKIPKIQPGQYVFRVYAENEKGNSSAIEGVYAEINTAHNATTAPLVLQRSDIECQTTSLKIFVPKDLVSGNGIVTWRDSACVVHSNGTHFVDSVGLRDCGTTLTFEADSVVFENDLILHKNGTQMQNGNNIVTYGSDYEFAIPVKCVYPRNSNISTSYIPIVQQVKILERRNGHLDLTMRQYEAEDYSHPVPFNAYPRQVPLNNDIFIRVAMENNVTGLGLSADNCFATSTPSPVDPNWYQLISSGCPINNAKIHPSGINDVKFSFHAFNFRHNTSGIVYVHCQVSVCLETDPACVVGCVTRKKRSASAREGAITSNLISTGPFIMTTDEGGVAMSTVVAAVSIAVAVIATVVAIIGWTRKSKKGADS